MVLSTSNFTPVFKLGLFYKERSGREDKLGGMPFGLPADRWPRCAVCGLPQNHLGQFRNSDKINLGKDGRTLFLFQCPDGPICEAWDQRSGANAAILIDDPELTETATPAPHGTEIEPEGIIMGWEPVEAGPYVSYAGPEPSYRANHSAYVMSQFEGHEPKGRFLLQLVDALDFSGPVPTPAETGAEHRHYWGGEYGQDNVRVENPPGPRHHYGAWSRGQSDHPGRPSQVIIRESGEWLVEWANFGGGTAYVFMDDETDCVFFFHEN
jgi:hypothetical protein